MRKLKKFLLPFLILLMALAQIGCGASKETIIAETKNNENHKLESPAEIHFIDVGQADCSIIISGEDVIVIDAGDINTSFTVIEYLNKLGIKEINYLILTHPHADHIGAAPDIINTFEVKNILMPEITTTSNIFDSTLEAISAKGYEITVPSRGDEYKIENGKIKILSDQTISWGDDLNSYSIALTVTIGDIDILFTGDADEAVEKEIVDSGLLGDIDIYQVGHHGSYTATSINLLETTTPETAIISCGKDNQYGHPHDETISRLNKYGINYYRTDVVGDIVITIDGVNYSVNAAPEIPVVEEDTNTTSKESIYIINLSSKKIHVEGCKYAEQISDKNKTIIEGSYEKLLDDGYEPCKNCM